MTIRRKLWWVSVLYFAEGFPFGIVIDNLPVYFRVHGVSLASEGSQAWTAAVAVRFLNVTRRRSNVLGDPQNMTQQRRLPSRDCHPSEARSKSP